MKNLNFSYLVNYNKLSSWCKIVINKIESIGLIPSIIVELVYLNISGPSI